MDSGYIERFAGIGRLYGREGLARLASAHVCVIGLGGVGSWAAEALARSGIGALTLVDMDDVCISNTNRQLHALDGAVGRPKTEVLKERVLAINPACRIETVQRFFTQTAAAEILGRRFSCVIDAIDSLMNKCHLITECRARNIPVVSSGGCAGKRDGTAVRVTDMSVSEGDRLLKFVRKRLRQVHGFPRGDRKFGIPCVWSPELSAGDPDGCEATLPGKIEDADDLRPNCEWGYGTAVFVSGAFGFAAAGVAINNIASGKWVVDLAE
ncbi:MAG: tRNA threonylcarbamoyladenosine dehydratase [Puniceicoccales bacterium]|jgi:tRNA A37 threonylcarbamoyladenosine dehydratase|nr:tRNA threonylcarbamoyladenosine dehydratase [Puniceicoccales bacterium]